MKFKYFLIFLSVFAICHGIGFKSVDIDIEDDDDNPFRHKQVLDKEGKYVLEWFADFDSNMIHFNVSVKTRGFVGFGLNKKGLMLGADMIIGGVYPEGSYYFSDRYGTDGHKTERDPNQDWAINSAYEKGGWTFLSFSRPFETCDKEHDFAITNDLTAVIWSYGETDNINEYHYNNRGYSNIYLLDPNLVPEVVRELHYTNVTGPQQIKVLGDWKVWRISVNSEMLAKETSYVCTYHKAPVVNKHHIVGIRPVMDGTGRRHIKQFKLYRCSSPKGIDSDLLFGRFYGGRGEECYVLNHKQSRSPTQFCQELVHAWATGGGPTFYPSHLGVPVSEYPGEYYMLQIHYDNPFEMGGMRVLFEMEAFLTSRLREHDAGMFYTGVTTPGSTSILLPPSEPNHIIYGHCSSGCTKKMIPETGINVFATLLHTHATGKGIRMLHIQNLKERAVTADDNYNPEYKPTRILRDEATILPGDMIVDRCIYDTTNRTGITVGGYSSRQEMCSVLFWYYPYIRSDIYSICSGSLKSDAYRNFLNIYDTTWSDDQIEEIVTSPHYNAGFTVSQIASRINWDLSNRTQLQTHHRFLPQVSKCPSLSPQTIKREILGEAYQNELIAPLGRYLYTDYAYGRDLGTLTNLNKEISNPEGEFVSLWPKDLQFYSPPSICPK